VPLHDGGFALAGVGGVVQFAPAAKNRKSGREIKQNLKEEMCSTAQVTGKTRKKRQIKK
jgi:hypothetical protein